MPDLNRYNGISFPFRLGIKGGVAVSTLEPGDLSRIRESITQILSTYPGERIMEPTFGCKIRDYVFEPDNPTTKAVIAFEVRKALEMWEKRIEVENVNVYSIEEWKTRNATGAYSSVSDGALVVEVDIFVYKYQVSETIVTIVS